MNTLTLKEKLNLIIDLCLKHDITAYEIGKETNLNTSGVQRILNNDVKKPRNETLNTILDYIENKLTGSKFEATEELEREVAEPIQQYIHRDTPSSVPYYNIELSGDTFTSFKAAEKNIDFFVDYKPLNNCTAFLPYFGDAMLPYYKSGNTLAVKEIVNFDVLLWGEPHLVITNKNANNYKIVMCLHQHPNAEKIILRAKNPDYSGDITINKSDIVSLYIVKGKIELKTM